jgi:hypothetical protein
LSPARDNRRNRRAFSAVLAILRVARALLYPDARSHTMTSRPFVFSALVLALVACDSIGPGSDSSSPEDAPPGDTPVGDTPVAATATEASGTVCVPGAAPTAGCMPPAGALGKDLPDAGSSDACPPDASPSAGCDKPVSTPTMGAACCKGRATCVPKAGVSQRLRSGLDEGSCATSDDLCVPNEYVKDPNFQPKACTSSLPFFGGKGACVSRCSAESSWLETDGCGDGNACAPCKYLPAGTAACNK